MRALILGGDGYLGWPTAMAFSIKNHDVMVVDNYLRRELSRKYDVEPLWVVPNLKERARIWKSVTSKTIGVNIGDCCDYSFLSNICKEFQPELVIHYAEQPSAPYSMMDHESARMTLSNNLISTLNIAWAVHEFVPECHIVKLGTMGVYGTPNIDIEEGWIDIKHKGREDRFLFPRQASSFYHTTKIQDSDMLWFYARTWGLRITDLHQGPVYGLATDETMLDERLSTIFSYDELFGTVINRFVLQSTAGQPLTIYGKGGQTRGYINLRDTIACVELAAMNPPGKGEMKIFNQVTETFTVNELAEIIAKVAVQRGKDVEIKHIENPRIEKEEHYYNPTYSGLKELGLEPNYLTDQLLHSMFDTIEKYTSDIKKHQIYRGIKW